MQQIQDGKSINTAFILNSEEGDAAHQIRNILDKIYGKRDGSYFIISETPIENPERTAKYKVVYVEDNKGEKNSFVFLLS